MQELIVYSSEKHPLCEELKGALQAQKIHYREINIQHPEAIRTLRSNGCFSMEPPVIQVIYGQMKTNFFTNDDLFWDGKLVRAAIVDLVQGRDSFFSRTSDSIHFPVEGTRE
jgi:hypothetical protein